MTCTYFPRHVRSFSVEPSGGRGTGCSGARAAKTREQAFVVFSCLQSRIREALYSSKIPDLKWTQVGAPGISASQVEALVLEIASEVTGHGVDPQDLPCLGPRGTISGY